MIWRLGSSNRPVRFAPGHHGRASPDADVRATNKRANKKRWTDERIKRAGTVLCECGCGTQIPALTRALGPRRFALGHQKLRPDGHLLYLADGYILERAEDNPRAHNGYVRQHILVWERANGRLLPEGWHVHHKNGIKDDNRPENLEAMPAADHRRLHPPPPWKGRDANGTPIR